jgi:hypothetical protein
MGIDIYAKWKGQTKKQKEAQYTGFSIQAGNVGYLREAYHGEPYATKFLLSEAFESKNGEAQISAEVLESRLLKTLELVKERQQKVYKDEDELQIFLTQKSFYDFVQLCKTKEQATGEACTITASY